MIVKMFLINAFTDGFFSGGRAVVVILRHLAREELLAALAVELNVPVTAYVLPYPDGFGVRYFSPTGELDSGGYATLAAAKVVYLTGLAPPDRPLTLEGRGGPVTVRPAAGLDQGGLSLVLSPARAAEAVPELGRLTAALGLPPGEISRAFTTAAGRNLLLCLKGRPALEKIAPAAAAALAPPGGLVVLSLPLEQDGYAVRCFSPAGEVAELPVSIDFHATLAPFWAESLGRPRLDIHHLAGRTAFLRAETASGAVELAGDLQLIYKAAPALAELTEDQSPDRFF